MLGLGEGWVVGVADGATAVEGGGVRGVERGVCAEAFDEVGVGDGGDAEGDGVGISGGQGFACGVCGEFLVGDEDAAEGLFHGWAEGGLVVGFAGAEEGEVAFSEFCGGAGEGGGGV